MRGDITLSFMVHYSPNTSQSYNGTIQVLYPTLRFKIPYRFAVYMYTGKRLGFMNWAVSSKRDNFQVQYPPPPSLHRPPLPHPYTPPPKPVTPPPTTQTNHICILYIILQLMQCDLSKVHCIIYPWQQKIIMNFNVSKYS